MRRCKFCGSEAYVQLRSPRLAMCEEHYKEYVERKVERTIHRYKMFRKENKILVAVSGGKDAIAVALTLHALGYEFECLHINLGIREYSEYSEKIVRQQCEKLGVPLHVLYLRALVGRGVGELKTRREVCSYCGTTKRYLMNKFAWDNDYDVIATGHNLDDESAFLLGNVLHWNTGYLARQGPYLPGGNALVARAKPLYELTNYEIAKYVALFDMNLTTEPCPHAKGAKSILYAKVLNEIEEVSPGTKLNFVKGFLKNRELFQEEPVELRACRVCGMPTLREVCSFCRMWGVKEELKLQVEHLQDSEQHDEN
ncbi:MAG: adenine nucleotide alpha hydrolase family protein [Euryarchaeota archaeon]|nr:adenine nucleotide alpha hydrolase family protein [Euryarchaeota archaeon]